VTTLTAPPTLTTTRADWTKRALWANLVGQIGIVVTGGAVRLTDSGLGCSTWPQCEPGHFTPVLHAATSAHQQIEFGNRTVTVLLTIIALTVAVRVWGLSDRSRALRLLGLVPLAGVLAQAVIGGVSVLAGLNPAVVGGHLLISMVLVAVATLLLVRYGEGDGRPATLVAAVDRRLSWIAGAVAAVVLILGVIVTGSGPHSGSTEAATRFGLDPARITPVHSGAVWCFVALVVVLVVRLRGRDVPRARTAVTALLAVTVGQGAIGYIQYFTGLPELLVGAHMLGAGLLTAAMTWTILSLRVRPGVLSKV
jgi:cytochrome c oxidase assembly protein subunit 15